MNTVASILSPSKIKTPRYAQYHGYEGIATMSTTGALIFRTHESGWVAVLDQADLVLLGACDEVAVQHALDAAAGDLVTIATSRKNLEVGR